MILGRPRKPTTERREALRAAAHRAIERREADPTLQEIYGPVPPTPDNPKGLGLAGLERAKRADNGNYSGDLK